MENICQVIINNYVLVTQNDLGVENAMQNMYDELSKQNIGTDINEVSLIELLYRIAIWQCENTVGSVELCADFSVAILQLFSLDILGIIKLLKKLETLFIYQKIGQNSVQMAILVLENCTSKFSTYSSDNELESRDSIFKNIQIQDTILELIKYSEKVKLKGESKSTLLSITTSYLNYLVFNELSNRSENHLNFLEKFILSCMNDPSPQLRRCSIDCLSRYAAIFPDIQEVLKIRIYDSNFGVRKSVLNLISKY